MKKEAMRSDCPATCALEILGDDRILLILRDLLLFEMTSFGEFLRFGEKIARNILTDRLDDLVASGSLVKRMSPDNKSKFLYDPQRRPSIWFPSCWSQKNIPSCVPNKDVGAFMEPKGKAMKDLRKRIVS